MPFRASFHIVTRSADAKKANRQMLSVPATSAAFHSLLKKKPTQTKLPGTHSKPSTPSLVCPATGQSAGLSSAHFWCLPIISQPSLLLSPFPSSQACWNLNFKWTPSMATIDRKGAFDCSCIAEKKGGGSSWLRPSRNSSSTAPQPLQWDAFACSYSFKLPASMFPFKEDKFFRFPLLRN